MYPKNAVTIFRNELDKKSIDSALSKRFVWSITGLSRQKYLPLHYEESLENTVEVFTRLRKKYLLYGYVYVVGQPNNDYYGGDCSDIGNYLSDLVDLGGRIWVTDHHFNWCLEYEYDKITLQESPYLRILNELKRTFKNNIS